MNILNMTNLYRPTIPVTFLYYVKLSNKFFVFNILFISNTIR